MKTRLLALLLFVLPVAVAASPPGVLRLDAKAPMPATYRAVTAALEEARFWQEIENVISMALRKAVATAEGR